MTTEKVKHLIASIISYDLNTEVKSYDELLEDIYDNQYRFILKVPTSVMFNGIIERYEENNIITIDSIKEVIINALEFGGTEVEFTDEDWNNLELSGLVLNTEKSFMMEFFEI